MKKSVSATIWSVLDRIWAQIISFFIGIVLARLLTPDDYGLVGISMVFIAFSNVFIEAGFSNALIRKLDRTNIDYSTAFHFNTLMGVAMYAVLYFGAPWIADYFDDKQLIPLTRLVSITVVLNSLCIVQNAILTAEFRMREQAIINIVSQIPSGLLAVYLAYIGWGIYALAVNTILASFIRTVMFWIVTKWWPSWEFSMESMRYLWGFGSKLIGANFLGTVFNEIYTLLIGKYVNKTDLGFYSKGRSLSTQPETICNGVIQKVSLPLLANVQNDANLLREKYRELTKMVTCVMTIRVEFYSERHDRANARFFLIKLIESGKVDNIYLELPDLTCDLFGGDERTKFSMYLNGRKYDDLMQDSLFNEFSSDCSAITGSKDNEISLPTLILFAKMHCVEIHFIDNKVPKKKT